MSNEGAAPGLLLVLSAPSGAGKTTLARRFLARHPTDALFSISVTTRPPRGTERDGVDYQFVSPARFAHLVAENAFAEWAEVHGHRYGTLSATVAEALRAGRIALFDIDVQGGAQLRRTFPADATTVFMVPPTPAELERRLRGRSTESDEIVARRLAAARAEVAQGLSSYDYVIVNDQLEAALAQLEAIASYERARRARGGDAAAAKVAERCRRGVADTGAWANEGSAARP